MHVKLHHARVDLKRGTRQNAFIERRICIDYPDKGQISDARGDADAGHIAARVHVKRAFFLRHLCHASAKREGMALNRDDVSTEHEER